MMAKLNSRRLILMALLGAIGVAGLLFAQWRERRKPVEIRPVREWFFVSFDSEAIHLRVEVKERWEATLRFGDIVGVCVKMEPDSFLGTSDGLYIWVRGRENSYAIPLDAVQGDALLMELMHRKIIPPDLLIKASGSVSGTFCWPETMKDRH